MKKKSSSNKGKYANELERLRELNAIKEVLKKSDIENAALTNTSKDSETVNDNVVDNMLAQLQIDKNSSKDLEIIESLTAENRRTNLINQLKKRQNKKPVKITKQGKIKKVQTKKSATKKKGKKR